MRLRKEVRLCPTFDALQATRNPLRKETIVSERLWQRLGAACGILYVVLLFVPSSIGSDAQIVIVVELIAMLLFIPFLAYLFSILRRAEGEGSWLSATVFGAGLIGITLKLGSLAPGFVAQQAGLNPQLHEALDKMNSVAYIATMLPLSVLMAAAAIVILRTRALPLWLGWMAALIAPTLLVNGMFLDAEFGPAFLLFLLWTAIASVVLILRAGEPRPVEKDASFGGTAPVG
jgi:hypothetical protein